MNDTPGRQIARYDGPQTLADLERYSALMAEGTTVLPSQYRKQPGAVLFAVEYAKALDVSPITALTGIHVIDGKPTASAALISALIRRAGHKLRVVLTGKIDDGTATATATLTRNDDPDPFVAVWDLPKAERAHLVRREGNRYVAAKERSAWSTYPEAMLKARALTEVARDGATDVLLGIHYTPEELGADTTPDGVPIVTTAPAPEVVRLDPDELRRAANAVRESTATERVEAEIEAEQAEAKAESADPVRDEIVDEIVCATTVEGLREIWNRRGLKVDASKQTQVARPGTGETTLFDLFQARVVELTETPPDASGSTESDDGGGGDPPTPFTGDDVSGDVLTIPDPADPEDPWRDGASMGGTVAPLRTGPDEAIVDVPLPDVDVDQAEGLRRQANAKRAEAMVVRDTHRPNLSGAPAEEITRLNREAVELDRQAAAIENREDANPRQTSETPPAQTKDQAIAEARKATKRSRAKGGDK